jgi:protein-glutamine gamma-glutamyltransferase
MTKLLPMAPTADTQRSRILWLLAAVATVVSPHIFYISPWISALLFGIFVWRYLLEARGWRLPSAWIKVPLVFAGLAAVALTYRKITGVEAGTALLIVMLALKILETRTSRDLTVVSAICWFLMFAVFLREQQLWAIPYIIAGVSISVAALIQIRRSGPPLAIGRVARQTAGLLVQALPLMLILFFLFPRIPAPFWAMSTGGTEAQTGLSDQVNPGDISNLSRSDSVAFRVRFKGDLPPPEERYWRGPVMGYFNGRAWSWGDRGEKVDPINELLVGDTYYEYELMLEPHGRDWLLALETPAQWSQTRSYLSANLQLISQTPVRQRIAYTARSYQQAQRKNPEAERHLEAMQYLPASSNPETLAFAQQLRSTVATDRDYLNAILQMFREQEFFYTLRPAILGGNPVDEFLFATREGFCEHYASAFATLARAAGIPARLVTGYLGGEINPLSNDLVIRQSDAHAWTEVWLDNAWVRVDPTAAVAPQRIELGLDEALSASDLNFRRNVRNTLLLSQAFLSLDAINAAWDRWVLAFGPEMQAEMLSRAGFVEPDMRDLVLIMAVGITLLLAGLAYYLRISIRNSRDPLVSAYQEFCSKLARAGISREPWEAPANFAARAVATKPAEQQAIRQITDLYITLRYEPFNSNAHQLQELLERIKKFRPKKV